MDFTDQNILRFIIAREYRFNDIIKDLRSHLEWRQINQPMCILNEQGLRLLKKGVMYIHGRCKDQTPLVVANMAMMGEMMDQEDISAEGFANMHHFLAGYMLKNMLVPG